MWKFRYAQPFSKECTEVYNDFFAGYKARVQLVQEAIFLLLSKWTLSEHVMTLYSIMNCRRYYKYHMQPLWSGFENLVLYRRLQYMPR